MVEGLAVGFGAIIGIGGFVGLLGLGAHLAARAQGYGR